MEEEQKSSQRIKVDILTLCWINISSAEHKEEEAEEMEKQDQEDEGWDEMNHKNSENNRNQIDIFLVLFCR